MSVEEIFLDALVNGANRCRSGETPDPPQAIYTVEAIRVKSIPSVVDASGNVNQKHLSGFPAGYSGSPGWGG
jgi:hypothetical protein